jgi:hypothetical protein
MVVTNFPALRRMGLDKQCRARPRTYVVPIGLSLVGSDSLSSLICLAPLPGYVSNHVQCPGTRFSAGSRRNPGDASYGVGVPSTHGVYTLRELSCAKFRTQHYCECSRAVAVSRRLNSEKRISMLNLLKLLKFDVSQGGICVHYACGKSLFGRADKTASEETTAGNALRYGGRQPGRTRGLDRPGLFGRRRARQQRRTQRGD